MSDVDPRYLRQVMLPQIGVAGQRRVGAAVARVGAAGAAGEIASRYALAAGFARVEPGEVDVGALAPRDVATDEAARAVLAGSRAALRALLAAAKGET